jgi:hypothetical protein
MGLGVKGAARDSTNPTSASQSAHPIDDLACRAASEGQQQDSFRGDTLIEQELHPGREGRRFPGPGPREYSKRSITKRGRLALSFVEISSGGEHMFDVIPGVFHRLGARKNSLLGPTIPSFGVAAMGIAPTSQGRGKLNVPSTIKSFLLRPRHAGSQDCFRTARVVTLVAVVSSSFPGHGNRHRQHHFGLGHWRLSMDG